MQKKPKVSGSLSQYLTIQEAAELLKLSPKTVRRRIADGTFVAYGSRPGEYRLKAEEVEQAMLKYATANWGKSYEKC